MPFWRIPYVPRVRVPRLQCALWLPNSKRTDLHNFVLLITTLND